MDHVFGCLRECFTCFVKNIVWIVVLAVLFTLMVLFLLMGGWDQAVFINMVIAAVAGAAIIGFICCLCGCLKRIEG